MEDGLNGSCQKTQSVHLRMDHTSNQREETAQVLCLNMVEHALKMKRVSISLMYLVIQVNFSLS